MKYKFLGILFLLNLLPATGLWAEETTSSFFKNRFDQSEEAFFPPEFGLKLKLYKSFPALWWNFVILQGKESEKVLNDAHTLCALLKADKNISQVECEQDPGQYLGIVEDWAKDERVRRPFPEHWENKINEAMAKASLPIPPGVFRVLRNDPFNTVEELRDLAMKRLRLDLERTHGFFFDDKLARIVIPVKFDFPPAQSDKIKSLPDTLKNWCGQQENCSGVGLVGPHGSTLENKIRISQDLARVSIVGMFVLLFCGLFFFLTKMKQLLILFLPIGIGTVMGTASTILYFGKIHGLTLSFGSGIIGLAIDYGLQAAFNAKSPHLWRSNFLGFLTTLVCLIVIYFTQIPLLKQIIWFSIWGFGFGFGLLYLFRNPLTPLIAAEPWKVGFHTNRYTNIVTGLCLVGILGAFTVKPKLDLRQFDYQSPFTRQMTDWVFQKSFHVPPLFQMIPTSEEPVKDGEIAHRWAQEHDIGLESINNYLPPEPFQEANLKTWQKFQCSEKPLDKRLPANAQKIFEPYLEKIRCEGLNSLPLAGLSALSGVPLYLHHLYSRGNWLRLWFPKDQTQIELVKKQAPEATSLGDLVAIFPKALASEMWLMLPLSLILVLLVLFIYYRKTKYALLGLLPFATGLGLCLGAALVVQLPLSFMSLIGLVMVLGFSVDYSVFAIDSFIFKEDETATRGRATGLIFAACSTLLGFLPLVFCKHPVLNHLGNFLVLGVIGTLVGTFWGIPLFFQGGKRA